MTTTYYTGIGSRQTPPTILALMTEVASFLSDKGLVLRSGHAQGADRAFERGAKGKAVIYLPWPSFGQKPYKDDPGMPISGTPVCLEHLWEQNYDWLASVGVHDYPNTTPAVRKLHGRNVAQVLGHHDPEDTLSSFVLYWCPEDALGNPTGGTATAVKTAKLYGIPSLNLLHAPTLKEVKEWICLSSRTENASLSHSE